MKDKEKDLLQAMEDVGDAWAAGATDGWATVLVKDMRIEMDVNYHWEGLRRPNPKTLLAEVRGELLVRAEQLIDEALQIVQNKDSRFMVEKQ